MNHIFARERHVWSDLCWPTKKKLITHLFSMQMSHSFLPFFYEIFLFALLLVSPFCIANLNIKYNQMYIKCTQLNQINGPSYIMTNRMLPPLTLERPFLFLNGVGVKVTTMNSAKPGKYWPNKLRVGGPLQKYQISVLGCRIRGFPLSAREAQFVSSHNWTGLSLTELLFHRGMHIRSKKLQIYFTGVFNYFTI